ncbi:MAG: ATPase, partial [Actinobacteria bacterium]|nr:ATPase [Actinomycetota bacterium]
MHATNTADVALSTTRQPSTASADGIDAAGFARQTRAILDSITEVIDGKDDAVRSAL